MIKIVKIIKRLNGAFCFAAPLSLLIIKGILLTVFLSATSQAQVQPPLKTLSEVERLWIIEHPTLTATNNMDLVPLDFNRDGIPRGFAIDYLNLAAKNAGLKIEYISNKPWEQLVDSVQRQEIDITHSLMINPKREKLFNFTAPYLEIPIVNFGRKGSPRINSISDMANKKIGVIKGWAITDFYRTNHPEFELVEYNAIKDALEGLSAQEVDVVTGSQFTLNYFISQNFMNDLEVIGDDYAFKTNNVVDHRIATRKDYPILRDILQKGMDAITPAQYNLIAERWGTKVELNQTINFTAEERNWLKENPKLTITNKLEMAPIDFNIGSGAAGFSIDYINLIAEKIGIETEYVSDKDWNKLLERVKNKEIDMAHSLVKTPAREEYLEYTKPYLYVPWVYFGRKGSDPISSIMDLNGKKIGIIEGSLPWTIYSRDYDHLNIIAYQSADSALNDLSSGVIDTYINLLATTNYKIKRNLHTNIEVTGKTFYPRSDGRGQLRLAFRKDYPILKSIFEKGMDAVTENEFSALSTKWYTHVNNNINIELTAEERAWLNSNNNKIRIAVDNNSTAPFAFIDENGELSGVSGDIITKISEILDFQFNFIEASSWKEAFRQVAEDESQILPAVIATEARKKDFQFTDPFYSETNMIFALKENINLRNMDSLTGYKIAQIEGDAKVQFIKENYPEIELIEVATPALALEMVSDKSVDAYIGIMSRTLHQLNAQGNTKIGVVGETQFKTELSIGIGQNHPILAGILNKAVDAIPDYEKQQIIQKWMAVQVVPKTDYRLLMQIAAIVLLILGMIIFWNNKLRREVKQRIEAEEFLKIEQEKTLKALEENQHQLLELQFQRETIEKSAEAQAELMDNLAIMSDEMSLKNDLLTEIMNNTGHGIVVFSRGLKLQAWNDTFKEIMNLEDREYEDNMDIRAFFELNMNGEETYELSIEDYVSELKDRLKNRSDQNEYVWEREKTNGAIIQTFQRIMQDGTIINTYKDVTLERREELRIQEMALTDSLTTLANRRAFDVNMEQAILDYRQTKKPFLLAYMDLDNFKNLNDTQGHKAGDLVLTHVANIMKKYIRENDIPARLGGDEFAIIFQNSDDIEATATRMEMIIQDIKNTKSLEDYIINVGASAGLAQCIDANISVSEMVEIADKALYAAKESGKGQVFKSLTA